MAAVHFSLVVMEWIMKLNFGAEMGLLNIFEISFSNYYDPVTGKKV